MEENNALANIVLHHMYESLPKKDQRRADIVQKATDNNYKMAIRSGIKEHEDL